MSDIKIVSDVPMPKGRASKGSLTEALRTMKPGDSFVYEKPSSVTTTARRVGVKVIMRKNGTKYRVWRSA